MPTLADAPIRSRSLYETLAVLAVLVGCRSTAERPAVEQVGEPGEVRELPAPVERAVRQSFPDPGASVVALEEKPSGIYEVEVAAGAQGDVQELYVTPSGEVIARQVLVDLEDVPEPVRQTILRLAGGGERIRAVERTVEPREPVVYEVEILRDGRKSEYYLSASGEVVEPGPRGQPPEELRPLSPEATGRTR